MQIYNKLEDIANKVRSKLRAIYLLDRIIRKIDQDIIDKSKDHDRKKCRYNELKEICGRIQNKVSSLDVETSKKKQLLETRFEQMKKLSEEAKKDIKDVDTLLQQSRKERNDLNNRLNNLRQELIQEEQSLIEVKKNRELAINSCDKAKKAINNLDTFIESLRQISQGQI